MLLKKIYTLVFLRKENEILLGLKKRGFGVGKWNGFGGKVENGEQIIDAAVRELKEESCVCVKQSDLKHIGQLEFTFEGDCSMMDVRVFSTTIFEGTPDETDEMAPKWFKFDAVPFKDMWPDDEIWFPFMLQEKLFYGQFHYQGLDKIIKSNMLELKSMDDFYKNKENI